VGGRGAVRRPHRLLHARGPLPALPRHRDHDALGGRVPGHDRGPSTDGGRLPDRGERAHLPGPGAADPARDRRLPHAPGGHRPQPRQRAHHQGLPGPGLQGGQRAAGAGADDVREGGARLGHRRGAAGPPRLLALGAAQRRAGARRAVRQGADRRARPREPLLELRQQAGDRRHGEAPRGGRHRRRRRVAAPARERAPRPAGRARGRPRGGEGATRVAAERGAARTDDLPPTPRCSTSTRWRAGSGS
jgi:hypothetical protein